MINVVGVRFKKAGKIYYFDPDNIEIEDNSDVLVETARGIEYGNVIINNKKITEEEIVAPLKKVIRIATDEDRQKNAQNKEKEKEAFDICIKKIEKHKLEMKLIDVEYTFDNNKVLFYFTAEGRIDFRELVKDLAGVFRTRIELRQIGVRDESKLMGGMGICGRVLCCKSYLGEFQPVSIKMAKEQGLSLNPTKISGICGRLMCCLKYEQDAYEEILERAPNEGALVDTEFGRGVVIHISLIKEKAKIKMDTKTETDIRELKFSEFKVVKNAKRNSDKINEDELKKLED
jgi:cell fate regulator YaaT (PSP1 superfamily)